MREYRSDDDDWWLGPQDDDDDDPPFPRGDSMLMKLRGEEREWAVLRFIQNYRREHADTPSRREIADRLDIPLASVQRVIDALVEKGQLRNSHGRRRVL